MVTKETADSRSFPVNRYEVMAVFQDASQSMLKLERRTLRDVSITEYLTVGTYSVNLSADSVCFR